MNLFESLAQLYIDQRQSSGRPLDMVQQSTISDLLQQLGTWMSASRITDVRLLPDGNAQVSVTDAGGNSGSFLVLSRGFSPADASPSMRGGIGITGLRNSPHSYSDTPDRPRVQSDATNVASDKLTPSKPAMP